MPTLASKLNARSEDFKANAAAMRVLVDDLNAKLATIALGGGEGPHAKHLSRGKLLPRDRVEMLLDPDTPFFIVHGEPFWGNDRRGQIEQWLSGQADFAHTVM
jgi:3-methylcrotonyl-CoA carboxylase beta subunit